MQPLHAELPVITAENRERPFLQQQQHQHIHLVALRAALMGLKEINSGQIMGEHAAVSYLSTSLMEEKQ